jgi:hypothetical protein
MALTERASPDEVSPAPMLTPARDDIPPDLPVHVLFARAFRALQPIGKGGYNLEQKFAFRAIEDIYDEVHRVLAECWLFPMPRCLEMLPESRPVSTNRVMHVVRLHVEFTFYGPKGDSIVGSMWGEGADMGDKSTSKAATMAEKSALIGMFCIAGNEPDPDSETLPETRRSSQRQPKRQPAKTVHTKADAAGDETAPEPDDEGITPGGSSKAQWGALSELAQKLGWDDAEKHRQAGVRSLKELTAPQARELAGVWAKMLSEQAKARREAKKAGPEEGSQE